MPTAATGAAGRCSSTRRMAAALASHHASGSCSAQPGRGVSSESGTVAAAATAPPPGLTRMAFTPLVPTSRPRSSESSALARTQQQLHRELIEPLVGIALTADRRQIERPGLERASTLRAEGHALARRPAPAAELLQERLDFRVVIEALHLFLQDQVGAHAAGGEGPDAVLVLRAVGVAVEVPHAGPAGVLEQLDEEKRRLRIVAPEPQVLVEAPRLLPVQADVAQLARFQRLGHTVREVEPGHALVRHLGVHTHHIGMIERINESEHVAVSLQEDVAPRLVGLRLEREPQVVAL